MTKRSFRIGGLDLPEGVASSVYFFSLIGLLALSAAMGIQFLLTALLVVKPPDRRVDELSYWGEFLVFPEWDILFYVGAIAFTLLVGLALVRRWNRRLRCGAGPPPEGLVVRQSVLQLTVSLAGTSIFLLMFLQARVHPPYSLEVTLRRGGVRFTTRLVEGDFPTSLYLTLAIVTAITLGAALAARTGSNRRGKPGSITRYLSSAGSVDNAPTRRSAWDLVVPAAIVALIYVTAWRQVAGRVFLEETLLHWDYFAMGPGLAFRHGLALGTEVHSAYGVGWPLVFSALSEWIPLSFGRMIQIASIYACMYLMGVYGFLRLNVRRPVSAALGTGLAVLPMFLGLEGLIIWRVPNVSMMRWPMDIWCLIALAAYCRTRSRAWGVVAGGILGLAVLFVTDTGMELTAAFGFFWVCMLANGPDRARRFRDLIASGTTGLVVLAGGLAVAGRGNIFNATFARGWLEAPLEFGGGFGMLPVATTPKPWIIVCLSSLFILYLVQAGYTLNRALHNRMRPFDLVNGSLALYGLMVLVKFMGHSADLIFPRLLTPAAIILTILLDRGTLHVGKFFNRAPSDSPRARIVPVLATTAAGLALLFLLARPQVQTVDNLPYPNLVSARVREPRPDGLCLIREPRDLCGMPESLAQTAGQFQAIVERLQSFKREGKTFGVIDETGSLFYAAADVAPFGRYSRPFTATHTKRLLRALGASWDRNPPDFILTRLPIPPGSPELAQWSNFGGGPIPNTHYSDTWDELFKVVHRRYRLEAEMYPFQIWRLTDPA